MLAESEALARAKKMRAILAIFNNEKSDGFNAVASQYRPIGKLRLWNLSQERNYHILDYQQKVISDL